jgi:hypothetical protein
MNSLKNSLTNESIFPLPLGIQGHLFDGLVLKKGTPHDPWSLVISASLPTKKRTMSAAVNS